MGLLLLLDEDDEAARDGKEDEDWPKDAARNEEDDELEAAPAPAAPPLGPRKRSAALRIGIAGHVAFFPTFLIVSFALVLALARSPELPLAADEEEDRRLGAACDEEEDDDDEEEDDAAAAPAADCNCRYLSRTFLDLSRWHSPRDRKMSRHRESRTIADHRPFPRAATPSRTALVSSSVHASFPLGFGEFFSNFRACLLLLLALELELELLDDEAAGDDTGEAASAAVAASPAKLQPYLSVG